MDIKEILELIEKSYSEEDLIYKNRVYFISYFISSLIFVLIYLFVKFYNFNILFIISLVIILGGTLIVRQQKLFKKTKCYFERIFEEITFYGILVMILMSIILLFSYAKLIGTIIATILGFLLIIDGVLFKSKKRKILGLIMVLTSIPMFIFSQYQFLILALVQFFIALCFLKK